VIARRLAWKSRAFLRRLWLAAIHANDPWDGGRIDVKRPAVRRMLARARLSNRREAGAGIVRKYSRDPVVERRERLLEQGRATARRRNLRTVA
jgi:hypothetical protein